MSEYRAATRYAKSLLELAKEQGVLETMFQDIVLIDNTIVANRDLALVLKSPIITHDKKKSVMKGIFGSKVNKLTMDFIELISRKGREYIIHAITKEFRRQYRELKKIELVTVTTTFELDDGLRNQIKGIAHEITNKEPELTEKVDEDIIGGFVLDLANKRIDSSIKSKLRKIEFELKN